MSRGGRGGGDGGGGRGGGRGRGRGRGRGGIGVVLDDLTRPGRGRGGGGVGGPAHMQTATSDTPGWQARGGGRGRGRGGGRGRGRGGAMSAQSQNAVGFDYSSLAPRARVQLHDAMDEGSDGEAAADPTITADATPTDSPSAPLLSLPQTSNNSSARASPSPADRERLERIRTGQVAGAVVPTGPRNMNRFQSQPQQELPVFKPTASKKKQHSLRPFDEPLEDACMGGIPRHMRKRAPGGNGRWDRDEPIRRFENEQRNPPTFVKARGEWQSGKWVRTEEGGPDIESVQPAAEVASGDNALRQGLGFSAKAEVPAAPAIPDSLLDTLDEFDDDGAEGVDELLKAFPGSSIIQEDDEKDATLGWYEAPSDFGVNKQAATRPMDMKSVWSSQRKVDTQSSYEEEDEEIILVEAARKDATPVATEDAEFEVVEGSEEAFFVDTVGASDETAQAIQYHASTSLVVGEEVQPEHIAEDDTQDAWQSSDEDAAAQIHSKKQGRKGRNARKKAGRRARHSNGGVQQPRIPREGDSDLEWGSDGPPPAKVQFRDATDQAQFSEQLSLDQLRVTAPQGAEEEEMQLAIALANSMEGAGRPLASTSNGRKKHTQKKTHKEAILDDYIQNALHLNDDDDEPMATEQRDDAKESHQTELDVMLRFMQGMDGQKGGRQMTLDDIAVEQQMQDEEEWMTESDEASDAGVDGAADDRAFDKVERRLAGESSSDEDGSDDDDISDVGDADAARKKQAAKIASDGWDDDDDDSDSDDEDSDDDDDAAFDKNFSWADKDEDFIARLDKFAQANEGILKGRNRAARNKLFKAIERGDFDMLDGGATGGINDLDMPDDDVALFSRNPVKKGKGKVGKSWKDEDAFAAQLQSQWEKDRAKKADNKRKRAEQRAMEAANPFLNTNGKGKAMNKKAMKKEARSARRAEMIISVSKRGDDDDEDDDVDMVDAMFGGRGLRRREELLTRKPVSMMDVDAQINLFLRDHGKSTLSLPPMDKRARAQIHQLASCYNLVSKSKGSGSNRFPTLLKNTRSGVNVQRRKVDSILRSSGGTGFGKDSRSGGHGGGGGAARKKFDVPLPRNQEGAEVGFGADKIGADNIGHRLLLAMGWTEGSGVGATQGMSEPVGATIKITKGGLGF